MKIKVAQGFIIQVVDDSDKVISSSFIPGDKFSLDTNKNLIDNGKNTFPLMNRKSITTTELAKQVGNIKDDGYLLDFNNTMPFGKYKDQKIGNIPNSYISWLAENARDQYMKDTAAKELNRRNKEGINIKDEGRAEVKSKGFAGFDDNENKNVMDVKEDIPF